MERWKKALSEWEKWGESIDATRGGLEKKYVDVETLIKGAEIQYKVIPLF